MYTLTVRVPAHVYSREHVCEHVDYSPTSVGLDELCWHNFKHTR